MPQRHGTTGEDTAFPVRLILSLALALTLLRLFVFDVRRVEGHSMEPTLRPGQLVVINRMAYGIILPFSSRYVLIWDKPKRGELVVFRDPTRGRTLIKRCVGVEGDPLDYERGRLTVGKNGSSYRLSPPHRLMTVESVPRDHVLVLGDNLRDSVDSRAFGFVPQESVYGRVFL